MSDTVRVWITQEDAGDIGIKGTEFPCIKKGLTQLVYELLKDGLPNDIVVLPFFRNFTEIVGHIRDRGITGPIIIYTNSEIIQMNLLDYAAQGVLFMDSSRFSRPMIIGFITFLHKRQELINTPPAESQLPVYGKDYSPPPKDETGIRELFRDVLNRRAKILLTCQFKEDLPTLTVTCEIIQIVGQIEPKMILDNFNPEEFVALYNQLGKGQSLTGFISQEEDTLGFNLDVENSRMGKLAVFLPTNIYEQKRKYFRVEPDPKDPVTLYVLPEDHHTLTLDVRDASEGGLGLTTSYTGLEKNIDYQVGLTIPKNRMILGTANVVFKGISKGDMADYGMTVNFQHDDQHYLQHYVFKRQAGILAMIKRLTI